MNENGSADNFRGALARKVSGIVLSGTIAIAIVGIAFAGITIWNAPSGDADARKEAFSVLQYIFGALLPLWGTWIGAILAYYFSKENFEAANKSVANLVDKVTSQQKLQSISAKDVMIPLSKLIYQELKTGDTLGKFKIKEDSLDFISAKGIKRVILLNESKAAKYVIHRDLISFFLAQQSLAGNPVANLTLDDMYNKGGSDIKNTMDNCVRFISENADLLDAKQIMDQVKTCKDVFITKNGAGGEPVLGWITDVTIIQNSVV